MADCGRPDLKKGRTGRFSSRKRPSADIRLFFLVCSERGHRSVVSTVWYGPSSPFSFTHCRHRLGHRLAKMASSGAFFCVPCAKAVMFFNRNILAQSALLW